MKRGSLKRKTRLRPRRPTKRRSARVHDSVWMERVRELSCAIRELMPNYDHTCYGPIHAHHMRELTKAGMGQKPSDDLCVPLCETHHDNWHTRSGPFRDKSREWRVAFAIAAVQETRARLGYKRRRSAMRKGNDDV